MNRDFVKATLSTTFEMCLRSDHFTAIPTHKQARMCVHRFREVRCRDPITREQHTYPVVDVTNSTTLILVDLFIASQRANGRSVVVREFILAHPCVRN